MSDPLSSQDLIYRVIVGVALGALVLIGCVALLSACSSSPPEDLGLTSDRDLRPCPSSPNCVSSQADDEEHHVEPFRWTSDETVDGDAETHLKIHRDRLRRAIEATGGVVKVEDGPYVHAEFTSPLLRFVDDVEFLIGDESVEVRSASRVGYSDLGSNRQRVEKLREAWHATE